MKRKPSILIIFPVLIVLFVTLYFYQRKDVEVYKIRSECDGAHCNVSFVLKNKTDYDVSCNVSIRALKRKPSSKSISVVTPGFAGEKILVIEMYPRETREFNEPLVLTTAKSEINVNAYNIKKK